MLGNWACGYEPFAPPPPPSRSKLRAVNYVLSRCWAPVQMFPLVSRPVCDVLDGLGESEAVSQQSTVFSKTLLPSESDTRPDICSDIDCDAGVEGWTAKKTRKKKLL